MGKPVLYANFSAESNAVKQMLNDSCVEYTSIFEEANDEPILITEESAFSYRGMDQIKDYRDLCTENEEVYS
jgi:hypothetical protein